MTYDWDLIKPEIRESYVVRKQRLVQVARAIRERYGFDIQSVTPAIPMMKPLL
jgi:Clr5 domain